MTSSAFNTLFAEHAMASYAKQLAFADVIENAGGWDLDLKAGTLSFSEGPTFKIGLLGSYGEADESWLWGWANTNMDVPPDVARAAAQLREIGRAKDIPELNEPKTHDEEIFSHRLSLIAVGETGASAYYRAPYERGSAWLLIHDDLPPPVHAHDLARVQRVIAESVSTFDLPHRDALQAYFKAEGLRVMHDDISEDDMMVIANDGDLRIRFDDQGRITEMKSLLRAATKPSGGFFNRLFRKDKNS